MQTIVKEEEYHCIICGQLPEKAHTSQCCGSVLCQICLTNMQERSLVKCPNCRNEQPNFQLNAFLIKMINKFPSECKYKCGYKSQTSEVRNHELTCAEKVYFCNTCSFSNTKDKFLEHVYKSHKEKILQLFDQFQPTSNPTNFKAINPLSMLKNSEGRVCSIGTTSKFYCGIRGSHICTQCDGQCGPLNGCNCASCMKLDVLYRNLDKNMLVNSEGRISTLKEDKYACGLLLDGETKCGQQHYCIPCQVLTDNIEYYRSSIN